MKKQPSALVQYTVRGIPSDVDAALRRKAAKRNVSLNQVIVDELSEAAIGAAKNEDFSDLVGKWAADKEFDRVLAVRAADRPRKVEVKVALGMNRLVDLLRRDEKHAAAVRKFSIASTTAPAI